MIGYWHMSSMTLVLGADGALTNTLRLRKHVFEQSSLGCITSPVTALPVFINRTDLCPVLLSSLTLTIRWRTFLIVAPP
jgi:hypothetical protein